MIMSLPLDCSTMSSCRSPCSPSFAGSTERNQPEAASTAGISSFRRSGLKSGKPPAVPFMPRLDTGRTV
jgi:hypothetical protein